MTTIVPRRGAYRFDDPADAKRVAPIGAEREEVRAPDGLVVGRGDESLGRVERVKSLVPAGMELPDLALRFILANSAVSTVIPGMRKTAHVDRNLSASDGVALEPALQQALRAHRWDRSVDIE